VTDVRQSTLRKNVVINFIVSTTTAASSPVNVCRLMKIIIIEIGSSLPPSCCKNKKVSPFVAHGVLSTAYLLLLKLVD